MDDRKVTAENKRLLALFEGADANRMDFIRENVRQLAWLNCEIKVLQKDIDKNGIVLDYQNGATQRGKQQNPAAKTLCDFQKLASALVKILLPLVQEKRGPSKLDMFYCGEYDEDGLPLDLENV